MSETERQPRITVMENREFLPTRQTLLSRLKDLRDHQSWQAFFDTYARLIYRTARQAGLRETEAEDVVQETVISVASRMDQFVYDPSKGSFKGWLLRITARRIQDQYRKRPREGPLVSPASEDTASMSAIDQAPDSISADLEARWEEDFEKHLLEEALFRVKQKVKPKLYQLFDLYAIKQWSPLRISQTMRVTKDQVYQARTRMTRLIKEEIDHLKKEGY